MPPNSMDTPTFDPEARKFPQGKPAAQGAVKQNYGWYICQATINMIGRLSIGIVVGICLAFAFRNGLPLNPTNLHIVLCVIGYQLLMAEAFLVLAPGSWADNFTLVDKRRTHTILQVVGSGLAIAGSIMKSIDNNTNYNTLHGQFALVAMVFTAVSLVNGLTSLYAWELRRLIPQNLSKLTHICFGSIAFVTSCVSLVYGMNYGFFRNWITPYFYDTLVGITGVLTVIAVINPLITFAQKSISAVKRA